MESHPVTPQTSAAEVLERLPGAARLFITDGMDCVGCVMEHFCTLQEVSLHYALEVEALILKLQALEEEGNRTQIHTDTLPGTRKLG